MIPSESFDATEETLINLIPSEVEDTDDNNSLTSVITHNDTDPILRDSHLYPSAPSPPLARMESFDILHSSHPDFHNDDDNDENEEDERQATPNTELMGAEDHDRYSDAFEGRELMDEPDAKFPTNTLIPLGPYGSGTFITDENNRPVFIPDVVNTYQQKKNLAQGMMDLALLSANANQLRYVLETFDRHPYNYVSLVLISCSLIFQVAVGIGLIMNSQYNVTKEEDIHKADRINNYTVIGIFLITVVNVFITSFGVADAVVEVKG